MKAIYIVTMGLLSALLLLGQIVMAPLPNIEPVTLLIIIYTLIYRKKVFYIIYTFALLEGLVYGFGLWWGNYLYVWTILALLVLAMSKNESVIVWSLFAGAYGLCFGALCSIPYFISGGVGAGLAYWIEGIPFDILHCAGNVVIMLVMFKPVYTVIARMHAMQLQEICNAGGAE